MKTEIDLLNGTPHKRSILSIVSDYDLTKSICELIDNALDIWHKSNRKRKLLIKIEFDLQQKTITISDNAGGVEQKHLEYLISPGATGNNQDDPSIGIFGVGTKRAVIALSEDVKIRTRFAKKDTFLIEFNNDWLKDDNWHLPYYKVDNISENTTIVELQKLLINIDQDKIRNLDEHLSTIYCRYLENKNLSIEINSKKLTSHKIDNWAYPPEYQPRKYHGTINTKEGRSVSVEVIAGLTKESSPTEGEYGVYFFCNDRLVANALKSPDVGFIKGIGGLPHPSLSILRIVVSLNGASIDMPWNSSKSNINANHYIFQALRNWIFDIVKNYSSLSRRLEGHWPDEVFKYKEGEFLDVPVSDFNITSKSYLIDLPGVNQRYGDVVKQKNVTIEKIKPWTKGLSDAIIAVDYLRKQKIETRNRMALILLDSNLEIAFKEYLVNDSGTHYTDAQLLSLFKARHTVEAEIKKYFTTSQITVNDWKKIKYYYDLRCKFIHQRATATVTDPDIDDHQKIVQKVLKVLFQLKF